MQIEQYVMAYAVEQDRLRALLPAGYASLRPVLRVNAEIRGGQHTYVELNTPVEKDGVRGWLNIGRWTDFQVEKRGKTTVFRAAFLYLSFSAVGIRGGCPAEKDNAGCFYPGNTPDFIPAEQIAESKEFCDCSFEWRFTPHDACGASIGKTLPAPAEPVRTVYPHQTLTAENAAHIPCRQVLGTYTVSFTRPDYTD